MQIEAIMKKLHFLRYCAILCNYEIPQFRDIAQYRNTTNTFCVGIFWLPTKKIEPNRSTHYPGNGHLML